MESRRFLLTGASGFVGANLCRRLVARGEEVHVFLRSASRPWRLEGVLDQVTVHAVDLRDAVQVEHAVQRIQPDVIYHLATHGAYPEQRDADTILLTNVFGFWNLLESCDRAGYELLVNTGSSSEYGRKAYAMRESDVLEPDSYYAVAKAAQSLLSRHRSRESGLPIVTLRLFSVYGPYEEPTRLIPRLMMASLEGNPVDMVSAGTARDFVYVDDVVDAFLDVDGLRALAGEILNVGTGVQSSLREVVDAVQALAGHPLDVHWGALPPRSWDSEVWVADISKIRRLTAYEPRTLLQEGLRKTLDWFREHRNLYGEM